jgi:hypothetical protein
MILFFKNKQKLKSKDGLVDKILPLLLCLVVVTLTIHVYVGWSDTIKIKRDADTLVREYILLMEAEGYLSTDNKEKLEDELNNIGVSITHWGETTFTNVGYGNEIILEIIGTADNRLYVINGWNSLSEDTDVINISLKKTSTAKN